MFLLMLLAGEPQVLWSNVTSGGVYCSVDMGDLNGDGVNDVVCGVNFWDSEPTLWALSGSDGSVIWTSDAHKGIYSDKGMAVFPDLTGNGGNELLLATPGGYAPPGRTLRLVSGTDGVTLWEWAPCMVMPQYTGWGYSCQVLPDLTGDGIPEAAGGFGTAGSSGTGLLACVNGSSGDSLWTSWQPDAVTALALFADVNGDGSQDLLAAIGGNGYTSQTARLFSSADGTLLWQNSPGGDCMAVTTVDRVDTHPLAVFSTFNGKVACYDSGGTLQWSYDGGGMYLDVRGGPDINGDGVGEVALAADNGGVICFCGATGEILWAYPSGANTWSVEWVNPVLLEGEQIPCVAAGSVNGRKVTLINALSGEPVWEASFDERVYNVSVAYLDLPSPVVIAGLQDQQATPHHAWALASSMELSVPETGSPGGPLLRNPSGSVFHFLESPAAPMTVTVFDLAGRVVHLSRLARGDSAVPHGLGPGCYLVRFQTGEEVLLEKVTVLGN